MEVGVGVRGVGWRRGSGRPEFGPGWLAGVGSGWRSLAEVEFHLCGWAQGFGRHSSSPGVRPSCTPRMCLVLAQADRFDPQLPPRLFALKVPRAPWARRAGGGTAQTLTSGVKPRDSRRRQPLPWELRPCRGLLLLPSGPSRVANVWHLLRWGLIPPLGSLAS